VFDHCPKADLGAAIGQRRCLVELDVGVVEAKDLVSVTPLNSMKNLQDDVDVVPHPFSSQWRVHQIIDRMV
jgi:hypothetical protein